ncbi:MAG: SoxR reducing system RseC family protein [Bacteroidales bacterium]|nr:SoxR reducing system RseC family protein [Bacteroidales bacterium]
MEMCAARQGVIQEIRTDGVVVRLTVQEACAACAGTECSIRRGRASDVLVEGVSGDYAVGDRVWLTMPSSGGFQAVLWAYLVPLVLVLAVLAGVYACTADEALSGLAALAALLPYFLALRFFRNRLRRTFRFSIAKDR